MDGEQPARVPDAVISEIKSRERNGFVELPRPRGLAPGMRVKVLQGPLQAQIGMLAALRPHERVLVLLNLLGGQQRVELARSAIEAVVRQLTHQRPSYWVAIFEIGTSTLLFRGFAPAGQIFGSLQKEPISGHDICAGLFGS